MNTKKNKVRKKADASDERFDFAELFIFTLALVLLAMSFLFRHSVVDGSSMSHTLENGEHLIVSDLFYTPARGDIIVFSDYTKGDDLKKPLVKRVIAMGGDTVRITPEAVYVNGERLSETYAFIGSGIYRYEPMEYTVSEGHLFVMGDNRVYSRDSRSFGEISEDAVLGKVLLRIMPFSKFGTVD